MKAQIVNSVVRRGGSVLAAVAFAFVSTSAHATSITVPGFSTASSYEIGTYGQSNNPTPVSHPLTGWTNGTDGSGNNAYNFNFSSITSAKGAGASNQYTPQFGNVILDSATVADPNCPGCAFLGLDSDYHTGSISTTLTGLSVGAMETVTFDFAGSQQTGFTGSSTDFIAVTFGGSTQNTGTVSVPNQGFSSGGIGNSGWQSESFTFYASSSSETLSFLAGGTSYGNVPAFALLDNLAVTQTPTPEPSSLMLLGTGLAGLGGLVRSRLSKRS